MPLSVVVSPGWWTGPYIRAIGQAADGWCERLMIAVDLQRDGARAQGTVRLPAFATASIMFRTNGFRTRVASRIVTEHFGDRTLQFLRGTQPVTVTINLPEPPADVQACLRVGLLGCEGTEELSATLNGTPLALEPVALQDVSLDAGRLGTGNRLEVSVSQETANPRLALAFASVVLRREPIP